MKTKHRIIALFMAVVTIATSINLGIILPAVFSAAAEQDELIIRDDALHFLFRHWHTDCDDDAKHQGTQKEDENWFVILEGYIVPPKTRTNELSFMPSVKEISEAIAVANGKNPEDAEEIGYTEYLEWILDLKHEEYATNRVFLDIILNGYNEEDPTHKEAFESLTTDQEEDFKNVRDNAADYQYTIVMVNQETGALIKVSSLIDEYNERQNEENKIYPDKNTGFVEVPASATPYISRYNKLTGNLDLPVKPLRDRDADSNAESQDLEVFSGLSFSAGRNAIQNLYMNDEGILSTDETSGNLFGIRIQFFTKNPTHLVKGHVFYTSLTKTVPGLYFDPYKEEIDTADVFTWAQNYTDENGTVHAKGDVVTYPGEDENGNPIDELCKTEDNLKEAEQYYNVTRDYFSAETTKFYSTNEGLHTNKTLVEVGDTGRLFLVDLEAWYVDGNAADVAFILDASGSMAFVSDPPGKVNVYTAVANRLGIVYDEETGEYVYNKNKSTFYDKNGTPYSDPDLKTLIKTLEEKVGVDKLCRIISDKLGKSFTKEHWDILFDRVGAIQNLAGEPSFVYPQRESLIGYYQFNGTVPKGETYTLDASELSTFSANTKSEGETTTPNDSYFTIIWQTRSTVSDSSQTWPDGYKGTRRIGFGGAARTDYDNSGATNAGSVNFETSDPAIVKIWWQAGGDGRQIHIVDNDGNEVDGTATSVNSTANSLHYSEIVLPSPGDYYLSCFNGGNSWIYKVEVTEVAPVSSTEPTLKNSAKNDSYAQLFNQFNASAIGILPISDGKLVIKGGAYAGIKLDAVPTSGKFTISFKINKDSATETSSNQNPADVWYVGDSTTNGNYLRVIREGRIGGASNGPFGSIQRAWLTGYQSRTNKPGDVPSGYASAVSAFNDSTARFVTYVFEDGKLTSYYWDGDKSLNTTKNDGVISQTNDLLLDGFDIIFNAFSNAAYNGATLYIDDVYVYDTALSEDEVKTLMAVHEAGNSIDEKVITKNVDWNKVFLPDDQPQVLAVLLNPNNTAHTPLGVAAYNYFVYDADSGTKEYTPLAYWDGTLETIKKNGKEYTAAKSGDETLGKLTNGQYGGAGWYYLTHGSAIADIDALGTAKRLYGLYQPGEAVIRDYADMPGYGVGDTKEGTGAEYTIAENSSIPFYIDENGNLRCFFHRGTQTAAAACSYVYELPDNDYVKTEALQRVLANFSTKLSERSAASKISAVRFSSKNFISVENDYDSKKELLSGDSLTEALKKLVLLDWTNDPVAISGIMSQKNGDGTSSGYNENPNGLDEYNYFLTGSTDTFSGLMAFQQLLASQKLDDTSKKYVVIFTDGADTTYKQPGNKYSELAEKSFSIADALKAAGYTIFTVFLPCGPAVKEDGTLDESSENFLTAQEFLLKLAGKGDEYQDDDYKKEDYFFASTNLADVERVFNDHILSQLADPLEGYTVRDYIDPRFDLQNANGHRWILKANGKVERETVDANGEPIIKKYDLTEDEDVIFHLSGSTIPDARNPYLRYDKDKDMYYLEWLDQTIPTTPLKTKNLLPVWNAEFYLHAKDDFIGGNTILTNGNEADMNWVFHPYDLPTSYANRTQAIDAFEKKLKADFGDDFDSFSSASKLDLARQYAKDDPDFKTKLNFSGDLNAESTRWRNLSEQAQALVKETYIAKSLQETRDALKNTAFAFDASSGTDDMRKSYEKNSDEVDEYEKPTDEYPSKGFPRTVANIRLLPIETPNIENILYMGEVVSPTNLLAQIETTEIESDDDKVRYVADSSYYEYLQRYAYQMYLQQKGNSSGFTVTDVSTLLYEWFMFFADHSNDYEYVTEFSIPYMYLPRVEVDAAGNVVKQNNTGGADTHERDVVGILTYRWERLNPNDEYHRAQEGENIHDAVSDYVKSNTNTVAYSLTVEFTALQIGDTLADLEDTKDVSGSDKEDESIFANYLSLSSIVNNRNDTTFEESFGFDRMQYVNGFPGAGDQVEDGYDGRKDGYKLINEEKDGKPVYQWDRDYKPEAGKDHEQPETDEEYYGDDVTLKNHDRTLVAHSLYTLYVVSGGIAIEMTMLAGELKDAVDWYNDHYDDDGTAKFALTALEPAEIEPFEFHAEFTLPATRVYDDKEYAGREGLELDYDENFKITFRFDYTREEIAELLAAAKEDPYGYVTLYAKSTKISGKFGDKAFDQYDKQKDLEIVNTKGLPIGQYDFKLNDINEALEQVFGGHKFGTASVSDNRSYKTERFDPSILDKITSESHDTVPEIKNTNITDYIVESNPNGKTVSFYVGTDSDAHRGEMIDSNGEEYNWNDATRYTNKRLGMLRLSSGLVRITIREKGAENGDNFIYCITGTTLGGKKVEGLYVRVSAKGETTIELLPGDYTVTEIPEWAWKYTNADTFDTNHEDGTEDQKYTDKKVVGGDWNVCTQDGEDKFRSASTILRHEGYDKDGNPLQHHDVTFVHERNDKVWLGGENHADNRFNQVTEP